MLRCVPPLAHDVETVVEAVSPPAQTALLDFLAYHVVAGVETVVGSTYSRTMALAGGPGVLALDLAGEASVRLRVRLTDPADAPEALRRATGLIGAAAPEAEAAWAGEATLGPLVTALPGLRIPGQVDGGETAIRTVIGQQVSVIGARTVTARIVAEHGRPVSSGVAGLTHLFPSATTLAGLDPETLPMPRARGRALVGLAAALAAGDVVLDPALDRGDVRAALLALRGIGPWTADYVALRVLGEPDAFLPTDIGVRNALRGLGAASALTPADVLARAEGWRPWRSHALMYLWSTLMPPIGGA